MLSSVHNLALLAIFVVSPFAFALTPVSPRLSIQQSGSAVAISWPATNTAFILQESSSLPSSNWAAYDSTPQFNPANDSFFVSVPITNSARFYRLGPAPVSIALGAPQQIFQYGHRDALGLFNVPDMHTALLQQPDGSYRLWITGNIGTNNGSVAMLSTTNFLDYSNAGPGAAEKAQAVFTPSCDGLNTSCFDNIDADYAGANAVITASKGTDLLMFYEAGNKSFGGTNYGHADGEFNVIALARSSDHGLHWSRQGAVLSGPNPKPTLPPGTSQPGISEPGLVIANGFIYMFFQYIPNQASEPGAPSVIQVARAPVAADGAPGTWKKYFDRAWNEPGLGGQADTLVATGPGCTRPVQIWPVFSSYLNAYLLLFLADEGWFFSTSTDLLSWATPVNFMPENMWQQCQPMDWNYIFVTPGKPAGVIDQTGYVLYAHTDSKGLNCPAGFSPHELWIRPFEFSKLR